MDSVLSVSNHYALIIFVANVNRSLLINLETILGGAFLIKVFNAGNEEENDRKGHKLAIIQRTGFAGSCRQNSSVA
jgi:hypothetical protein